MRPSFPAAQEASAEATALALVLLLRVIPVDLLASFTDLFHDDVGGRAFDDALDCLIFVSCDNHEPVSLPYDTLVVARGHVDRPDARGALAFAVEGKRRFHPVLLGALLNALVDASEDLFVSGSTIGKVHSPHILHDPHEP